MSAFVVADRKINRILAGVERAMLTDMLEYVPAPDLDITLADMQELGQRMHDLNVRAVQQRYPHDGIPELPGTRPIDAYEHNMVMPPSPIELCKLLHGYLYQCCEGDGPEHELYKQLDAWVDAIEHRIVSNLDAYERAKWV